MPVLHQTHTKPRGYVCGRKHHLSSSQNPVWLINITISTLYKAFRHISRRTRTFLRFVACQQQFFFWKQEALLPVNWSINWKHCKGSLQRHCRQRGRHSWEVGDPEGTGTYMTSSVITVNWICLWTPTNKRNRFRIRKNLNFEKEILKNADGKKIYIGQQQWHLGTCSWFHLVWN